MPRTMRLVYLLCQLVILIHAKFSAMQPGIHVPNGSVARLIDFAPGVESPFHRAMSIDYGVVIEGTFELSLDSGEKKIMHPGDISEETYPLLAIQVLC